MANVNMIGIGIILVVVGILIAVVALEPLNVGIADYADGPDNVLGGTSTDDPPSRDTTLLELTPFALIAAILLSGVAVLVKGARSVGG